MNRYFFVAGRVLQIVLMFATLKIGTILLPPAEMAVVFMITAGVSLVSSLFVNPVGMFMNRRIHAWVDSGVVGDRYLLFYAGLVLLGGISSAVTLLTLRGVASSTPASTIWISVLLGVSLIATTANATAIPGLNMLGLKRAFIVLSIVTSICSLAFASMLVELFGADGKLWVAGLAGGQLLLAIVAALRFPRTRGRRDSHRTSAPRDIKPLLTFAWPIAVSVGLAWVQSQSYRLLAGPFLGLQEVGLVAAGLGVSVAIVASIESILSSYLLPEFYKTIHASDGEAQQTAWYSYARIAIPIYILTGCYLAAVAPELVKILMGPSYFDSRQFVYWGIWSEISRAVSYTLAMILHARYKTRLLMFPAMLSAGVSLSVFYAAIGPMQGHGIGLALASAATVGLLSTYLTVMKEMSNVGRVARVIPLAISAAVLYGAAFALRRLGLGSDFLKSLSMIVLCGAIYLCVVYLVSNNQLKGT